MELFKTVNYFGKNPHLKCLKVFSIRLWLISILLVFILIDVHEDWIGSPLMTKIFASHNFLILNTMSFPEQSDKNKVLCPVANAWSFVYSDKKSLISNNFSKETVVSLFTINTSDFQQLKLKSRASGLVVSDLRSETKCSWLESGC